MNGANTSARPAWGAKKSGASAPPTESSSREPTPSSSSSSSAFPPLSSPLSRRGSARPSPSPLISDSSLISSSSFNPYPTRRQELALRAASHGTRKRSHITRTDPSTSRIHSLIENSYDEDDAIMHNYTEDDDNDGQVSSRGATMSSIVFRDLSTSTSTGASSLPWQQGSLSPGLAMFATTTFGGEPLRVLANVDEELGAAHMGPRIYKRHNQKHVRNKVKAKIDASHTVGMRNAPELPMQTSAERIRPMPGDSPSQARAGMTTGEQEYLRRVDLPKLVDECRRCHNITAIQRRAADDKASSSSDQEMAPFLTLLAAIKLRLADPGTWVSSSRHAIISDDLLPIGLQGHSPIDFSFLPPHMLVGLRQSVLQGLSHLLDALLESMRHELVETLSRLLRMRSLRPTSTENADLKSTLQQTFLRILEIFDRLPVGSSMTPVELLSDVLKLINAETGSDALVDLVGELVGLCGQQMSSDPSILTETQDRTLVTAASFLSLCFTLNSSRPARTRLPAHAFYCTVLDLAPFVEHFIHHVASLVHSGATPTAGLARFNVCAWPFLLSLGAKVQILQFENEVRLSRTRVRESCQVQRFTLGSSKEDEKAELVVMPNSLNLRIDRHAAWRQSRTLLLQLLESGAHVRGLRVEFAGEQAADGGGPAREWFATVASNCSFRDVLGPHGWFIATCPVQEKESQDAAAFLGMLLALAALHTTKLALPFSLPSVAFKIANAPKLEQVQLTPVDLEFADPALAKSLQSVLDWTLTDQGREQDADKLFDSTFSLSWSTNIWTAQDGVKTVDLIPGGRHRAVKVRERREFVSKLISRVLIGSVSEQVMAFRDGWQSIMASHWLSGAPAAGVKSASDVLSRGGAALSLFSPEEINQAIVSVASSSTADLATALDVADIKVSTELILATSADRDRGARVAEWFWTTWSTLAPHRQRRLLAFITGAQDVPASGARGIGLRIHLVNPSVDDATDGDARSWPLPWSSTCTSTLFLPVYPAKQVLEDKLNVAIEHYQGFGLR